MSKIEWTEKTWNPVTGCTKISQACANCYAEVMAKRLSSIPATKEKYKNGFKPTIHLESLEEPLKWKKPSTVFVCSMGDLFHRDVPCDYIDQVIQVIRENPQHTFQILTKRAERMAKYFMGGLSEGVPRNAWLGVTCERANYYDRIDWLRWVEKAPVRFLSCEPLLGPMNDINLDGIDWVITGGESGPCARRTPIEWFRGLRDACRRWNTPFFFKQWGAWGEDGVKRSKYKNGHLLDGEEYRMMPGDMW